MSLTKYNMNTKMEYEAVGHLMFKKYACIQVDRKQNSLDKIVSLVIPRKYANKGNKT